MATVRKLYKWFIKSYINCRSNSFPDPVMVEWEEESQTLLTKAIEKATVSGEKVGQLNAARAKSRDSTSASTFGEKVTFQPRACR